MEEIIDPTEIPKDEKTNAMVCHLLAYLSFSGIPLGGVLGPLIMWIIKKNDSPFIDECGKEAINFQISMIIYTLICIPFCFILVGYPMLFLLLVIDIICIFKAANAANRGILYQYPWTIRFIK